MLFWGGGWVELGGMNGVYRGSPAPRNPLPPLPRFTLPLPPHPIFVLVP